MDFRKFNTFIFDLDGTVWNWVHLFPGVDRVLNRLRKEDKQVIFLTNNTLFSRKGLLQKIHYFGLEAKLDEVIHPGLVACEFFKEKRGKLMVFSDGLKEDLKEAGIKVSHRLPVKYLLIGHDPKFDYKELTVATEALNKGAEFYSAATGRFFVWGDHMIPGTGAIVEVIEYESGKKSILLGKPSSFMNEMIKLFVESPRNKTVLIGDELLTDIITGKQLGYSTVLVKTGVDKKVGKLKPNLVLNSAADIRL
jgi:HAD superfamily hydrolase (TIGR01450 family)